jgi:hypothetical protein
MTNTVAAERQRLRARLAELDAEHERIMFALSVLDRIDAADTSEQKSTNRRSEDHRIAGSSPAGVRPGGTLDRAVAIINESDRAAWTPDELLVAMRENGWAAQVENEVETVRSALSRATRQGLIARVAHGMYGPLRPNEPQSYLSSGGDASVVPAPM